MSKFYIKQIITRDTPFLRENPQYKWMVVEKEARPGQGFMATVYTDYETAREAMMNYRRQQEDDDFRDAAIAALRRTRTITNL